MPVPGQRHSNEWDVLMSEVKLSDGKVINVDVSRLTVKEWRDFIDPAGGYEAENAAVAKCTGLSITEIEAMPFVELKQIAKAIILAIREPLADPS